MVAIRIDARCLSCDSVAVEDIEDGGVKYVMCTDCGCTEPLKRLQERLTRDYNAFLELGVKAVAYRKGGWFL